MIRLNLNKQNGFVILKYLSIKILDKLFLNLVSVYFKHFNSFILKGHKFIEETNYEQSWQLVARSTIQYLNAINKNTPEALDIIANLNNTPRPQ